MAQTKVRRTASVFQLGARLVFSGSVSQFQVPAGQCSHLRNSGKHWSSTLNGCIRSGSAASNCSVGTNLSESKRSPGDSPRTESRRAPPYTRRQRSQSRICSTAATIQSMSRFLKKFCGIQIGTLPERPAHLDRQRRTGARLDLAKRRASLEVVIRKQPVLALRRRLGSSIPTAFDFLRFAARRTTRTNRGFALVVASARAPRGLRPIAAYP